MHKNVTLDYNRVIWNAKERKGLQGKRSIWGRGIDAIQKQKNATKQRKSLHDLCSTSRVNYIKKKQQQQQLRNWHVLPFPFQSPSIKQTKKKTKTETVN